MSLNREKIEYGSITKLFSKQLHRRNRKALKKGINRRIRYIAKKIDEDSVADIKKPYKGREF